VERETRAEPAGEGDIDTMPQGGANPAADKYEQIGQDSSFASLTAKHNSQTFSTGPLPK
jgi:hypothetical protein